MEIRNEAEIARRHAELVAEEVAANREEWWWCSFVGDEGFRGVAIVRALGPMHAARATHEKGINPGGWIRFTSFPDDAPPPPPEAVDRLLNATQLREFFGPLLGDVS